MDNICVLCLIRNILKFHISMEMLPHNGLLRLLNLRLLAVGRINLLCGGRKTVNIIDPPACHTKRNGKHPQVAIYGNQITHGDFTLNHHITAIQHQNDRQYIGKKFKNRYILFPDGCSI